MVAAVPGAVDTPQKEPQNTQKGPLKGTVSGKKRKNDEDCVATTAAFGRAALGHVCVCER